MRIEVTDDGCGFDQRGARGYGLLSIERRMACLHGGLELHSAAGAGTTATLRLSASQLG